MRDPETVAHHAIRQSLVALLLLSTLSLASSGAKALPGEVLSEQKISSLAGTFAGTLDDLDQFGVATTGIGDLDGDGIEDLAVGAWADDDGGGDHGAIWVLFMNADGTVDSEQKISETAGGFGGTFSGGTLFGGSIAALGDLDGDGVVDLAVSAHSDDTDGLNLGSLWILFLNSDGTVKAEQRVGHNSGGFSGTLEAIDNFGFGVSTLGDLDGDGVPELAVGAFGDDDGASAAGAVYILFLLPDGTVHHTQKISATSGDFTGSLDADDWFGIRTAGLGDLDADGVVDLAVSAHLDDDGGMDRGAVWILFLNENGTVKSHQKISDTSGGFTGALENSDVLGFGLGAVGDVDGDAIPDLAVGAPGDDDGGMDRGAVWILFLDSDGTVSGHQKISDTAGSFGGALSDEDGFGIGIGGLGDLDGDVTQDLVIGAFFDGDGGSMRGAVWILNLDGLALTCGNAVLDPVEECDDGNVADFDGCTASCQIEDDLAFFGVATNVGSLSVTIDGVNVDVGVLSGDTPALLAQLLAIFINGDPTLMSLGITAQAMGDRVYTNGTITSATTTAGGTAVSFAPGSVLAQQKISDFEGGFTGILDDNDALGRAMAVLGDLDGDGVTDLAVGAIRDDDGGTDRGAVWILFLNADGTVKSHQKISNTEGGFAGVLDDGDFFGIALASLGDLDGDGSVEIAVGVDTDDDGGTNRGAVWILFLNADGTVKAHQKISDTEGGFTGQLEDSNLFGHSVTSLGDLDGDGNAELVVGADGDSEGGTNRGAVWILFLNADGTVKAHQKISDTEGGFTGQLEDSNLFGHSVTSLGDLDGDGNAELVVGADGDSEGGTNRGAVWILFLNADGTVKAHQKINDIQGGFTGALADSDFFGHSCALMSDLDGDGVTDLAVGANGDNDGGGHGAVWILFLNTDGTVKDHQKISDTQGDFRGLISDSDFFVASFGTSLHSFGDRDGDGNVDLGVGAYNDDDGGLVNGAMWLLFLNSDGTVKAHQKISDLQGGFTGPLINTAQFGRSATLLGDLDDDGIVELAVGSSGDGDGGQDHGAVWILSIEGAPPGFCGDAFLEAPEFCDDGNAIAGDGCYSTCEEEYEIELFGTAQGGSIQVVLGGVPVMITTSAGQSAATVATNLGGAVNVTLALRSVRVSSVSIGGRLVSNGRFDSYVSMDPGITVPEPGLGRMLMAGALALALLGVRRPPRKG